MRQLKNRWVGRLGQAGVLTAALIPWPIATAAADQPILVSNVAAGAATFTTQGSHTTIQAADRTIINYSRFDIPAGAAVRFVQPSSSSTVLNRIQSVTPSRIDGSLSANGVVYLVNPSGVMFGPGAVVNVAQLFAAGGQITDADFLNGVRRFVTGEGSVINEGTIHAADGAGLIGSIVKNIGAIYSPRGVVTLASGKEIYLQQQGSQLMVRVDGLDGASGKSSAADPSGGSTDNSPGVVNSGMVAGRDVFFTVGDVYSLALVNSGSVGAPGGNVTMAGKGRVENSGSIDVSNATPGAKGGSVKLLGNTVTVSGSIDASGDAGGGRINVGGEFQGGDALAGSQVTHIRATGSLKADALAGGDGGRIIVWSDGSTGYFGSLSARGGASGGGGGFAEISGHQNLSFNGTVDLAGVAGIYGRLLLDPKNAIVNNTGGTPISGDRRFTDNPAGDETFSAASIVALLNGAGLTIQANNDIIIDAAINSSDNSGPGDLFLEAGRSILINADITLKGELFATANVEPNRGVVTSNRDAGIAVFNMASGTTINTSAAPGSGVVEVVMGRGDLTEGNPSGLITLQNLTAKEVRISNRGFSNASGITLNGNIDASSGEVELSAILGPGGQVVTINGTIANSGGGVTIDSGRDIVFGSSSSVSSAGSFVEVFASQTSAAQGVITMADGAQINAGGDVTMRANGNITVGRIISNASFGEAVEIISRLGSILDGGDTGGSDIQTPNGGLFLSARNTIGAGLNPLEISGDMIVASTRGGNGSQFYNLTGDVSSIYLTAGTGDITLTSTGFLADDDAALDFIANSATVSGALGVGTSVEPINIAVTTPNFTSSGGGVFLDTAINNVILTTTINQTGTFSFSTSGTLTVNAPITVTGANGDIVLLSSGDMTVNSQLTTAGLDSNIVLQSGSNINLNAALSSTGSGNHRISAQAEQNVDMTSSAGIFTTGSSFHSVQITADALRRSTGSAGAITMADGVQINGGTGSVELKADQNIALARILTTSSDEEAVQIRSDSGAITNAGNSLGANIEALSGRVELEAVAGIGSGAPLQTNIFELQALILNGSGDIQITQGGDLRVSHLIQFNSPGDINLTVNSGSLNYFSDEFGVFLGGGILNFTGGNNVQIGGDILGASSIAIRAGSDGTGDLEFGVNLLMTAGPLLGATSIHLRAGDGLGGGGSLSEIAFDTAAIFLSDSSGTGQPSSVVFQQDASLFSSFAPFDHVVGGLDGVMYTLRSDEGTATVNAAPALGKPQLSVIGEVDLLINTALNVQSLDLNAGNLGISILGQIESDGDVTINTSGDIFQDASILVNNAFSKTIRFNANGNVVVGSGADITANAAGPLDVILNSDRDLSGAGAITIAGGTVITTQGGGIILGGGASPLSDPAQGGALPVGVSLDGVQMNSSGGNISIRGEGGSAGTAPHAGVFIQGSSVIQSGAGTLLIAGDGGSAASINPGIELVSSTVESAGGNITLQAAAGSGTNNAGLEITSSTIQTTSGGSVMIAGTGAIGVGRSADEITNSLIQTAGNGNITISGLVGSGIGSGMNLRGNLIKTINGTVSLTGSGGNASVGNNGIVMNLFGANPNVIQTTSGAVELQGDGGVGDFSNGIRLLSSTIESLGAGTITFHGSGFNSVGAGGNSTGINLLTGTIRSVNGDINLVGNGAQGPNGFNHGILTQTNSLIESTGAANILLNGTAGTAAGAAGGSNVGVDLDSVTIRATAASTGLISIVGTGAATATESNGRGIQFGPTGALVSSLGSGTITLQGFGASGASECQGVVIQNPLSQVLSVSGAISITGSGGGTGNSNIGVFILDNAKVQSTGSATITINGTSANGASASHGVAVTAGGRVESANSTITISGVTSGGLAGSSGIFMQDGVILATGSGAVALTGGGSGGGLLDISLQSISFLGSSSSTGNLTLTGERMSFNSSATLDGAGNLLIQPAFDATTIGINDAGTLRLLNGDLAAISDGFNSITFGRSTGQHIINIGPAAFSDPVIFRSPIAPGHIFLNGALTGSGNASFTFNGSGATTTLGGDILTAGNPVAFNDSVVLTNDVTINTANGVPAGANVTFANKVNGSAGTEDLTINTGSTGDLGFNSTVGQTTQIGDVHIVQTDNLTAAGDFRAATVTQDAGNGQTRFAGALETNGSGGVNLTGNSFRFEDDVITTAGGGFTLGNNSTGVLTIGFLFNIDGPLNQTGNGAVQNGRLITTTGDDVHFAGPLVLLGNAGIDTTAGGNPGGANITFNGPVNSTTGNEDFTLNAGNLGDILFGSTVGQTQPLGDTTITNAHDVTGLAFIGSHTFTQQAGAGDTNLTNVNTDSATASIKGQTEAVGKLVTIDQSNFASEVAGAVMFAGGSEGGEARELDAQTAQALGLPAGVKANPVVAQRLADRLREMSTRPVSVKVGLAQLAAGGENPSQWARSVSPQDPLFQQLAEVNEALDMVNLLGLSPQDAQTVRRSILDRFRPEGMSDQQLQSLLNAVRARGLVVSGAGNE